jgi:hypothetical protein
MDLGANLAHSRSSAKSLGTQIGRERTARGSGALGAKLHPFLRTDSIGGAQIV